MHSGSRRGASVVYRASPSLTLSDEESPGTAVDNPDNKNHFACRRLPHTMGNIQSLSYFVAQSTDVSAWKAFGEQVLGAQTAPAADGALYLKLDQRPYRMLIVPGSDNRYLASGWELPDEASFDAVVRAIRAAGIEVSALAEAAKTQRQVRGLAGFVDPSGNHHELIWGSTAQDTPFLSPLGAIRFKTGKFGIGHTVLPALNFDATLKFFREVLGFGLSDVFNFQPGPDAPVMRIYFLHAASGRHHSLALAEMPNPSGCVHVMVEVEDRADVDRAEERRAQHGAKLMATLGQHENDRMTSFYMMTPGGFALEYGWGGIEVDPASWQTTHTKQVSLWGHDFSVGFR